MIDFPTHIASAYEKPALVRVGAIVDIAAELEKVGVTAKMMAYVPGDPVDWSNGRVS